MCTLSSCPLVLCGTDRPGSGSGASVPGSCSVAVTLPRLCRGPASPTLTCSPCPPPLLDKSSTVLTRSHTVTWTVRSQRLCACRRHSPRQRGPGVLRNGRPGLATPAGGGPEEHGVKARTPSTGLHHGQVPPALGFALITRSQVEGKRRWVWGRAHPWKCRVQALGSSEAAGPGRPEVAPWRPSSPWSPGLSSLLAWTRPLPKERPPRPSRPVPSLRL